VVRYGSIDKIKQPGFSIGAKSGTSEIAYKWDYRGSVWWTNGSAVAMVTRDTTKYIIVIQVRRPRTSKWGNDTAVKLVDQVLWFLLEYSSIEK
jgi:cell division protein FtsI/penicillin-binding protein 2